MDGWCGTALRLDTPLGRWYHNIEILTLACYFQKDRRLFLLTKDKEYFEFHPHDRRSRTRFNNQSYPLPINDQDLLLTAKVVDVSFRNNSIYVISQQTPDFVPIEQCSHVHSLQDLYRTLPPTIQRVIGQITWPPTEAIDKIASAIQHGTVIGVSDGSVRRAEDMASHAWIIQAGSGEEIRGRGPVDGSSEVRTPHRAELQGHAAIFTMIALLTHFYSIAKGKITTFCDNTRVVNKMQKGWEMLRLRHTKGADTDLQMILKAAIEKISPAVTYTTTWVKSHQDDDGNIQSLSIERRH